MRNAVYENIFLSRNGVPAFVEMAGGAIAPRVMPQVEQALTNKVGNVKQILKEGVPKLDEPVLATPSRKAQR